jgi:hypothetical protein
MNNRQILIQTALMTFCLISFTQADEVRYLQENGITYCETYRMVQRQVTETSNQQSTRTVYKEHLNTETRDVTRTWWCPVTTYRAETEMVGRWNFFIKPYYETRWVAETQWVQHSEVVKMPVTCRKLVPETQTIQVPVTTQKIVCENVLLSRVAVSGVSPSPAIVSGPVPRPTPQSVPMPTPAQRYQPLQPGEQIGGVARLNQDPPRYGTSPSPQPATR